MKHTQLSVRYLIVVFHFAQRRPHYNAISGLAAAGHRETAPGPPTRHRKEVAFLERNLIDRRTNDFQNAGQLPFPITIRLIHLVMTLIKCIVRNTRRVRSFHTIREPVKKSVANSTLGSDPPPLRPKVWKIFNKKKYLTKKTWSKMAQNGFKCILRTTNFFCLKKFQVFFSRGVPTQKS